MLSSVQEYKDQEKFFWINQEPRECVSVAVLHLKKPYHMSSDYVERTEGKPAREFDTSRVDRDVMPGGPMSQSYENYIKNIFRPREMAELSTVNGIPGGSGSSYPASGLGGGLGGGLPKKISASAMLKMEEHLGKDALDDTMDEEALESPLDAIYQELGIGVQGLSSIGTTPRLGSRYPVYTPKSSKEYFSVRETSHLSNLGRTYGGNTSCTFRSYKDSSSYKQRADEEYKKNNRQTLVDYKDFDSSPLSPYMYQSHPYVQRQDSRIVGSNFVQLTSRPRDRFLEKLDETLADISQHHPSAIVLSNTKFSSTSMQSRGRGLSNMQPSRSSTADLQSQNLKKPVVAENPSWDNDDDEAEVVKMGSPLKESASMPPADESTKVSKEGLSGVDFGDTVTSNVLPQNSSLRGIRGRRFVSNNLGSNYSAGTHSNHPGSNGLARSNFAPSEPLPNGYGANFGNRMNLTEDSITNERLGRGIRGGVNGRGVFHNNQNFSNFNNRPSISNCGLNGSDDTKCFICHGTGHYSKECPEFRFGRPFSNRQGTSGRKYTDVRWELYTDYGPSYVPMRRSVDQIFGDDIKSSSNYLEIRISDDDVSISGPGGTNSTVVLIENWDEAKLHESLRANIERACYAQPRKIQSYTIPLIMEGRDLNGVAETGSGKSAAFLIPIIDIILKKKETEEIASDRSRPLALIIEPTREMAIQLSEQAKKLANGTNVTVAVAYGKFEKRENLREISKGCDILVGTPGRLKDFFTSGYVLPENLKFLVIDEADHLLEDQFLRELRDIASVSGFPKKEHRQTIFFSATCPDEIQLWSKEWMSPKHVFVSNNQRNSANHKIVQSFVQVSADKKKDVVFEMLKKEKEEAIRNSPHVKNPPIRRTLLFMNTKRGCDVLASFLSVSGIESVIINGDQPQETRDKALEYLRKNEVQVAVTTDVCARGIDIKDLDHVINVDMPRDYVTYVHRIGRTGRLKTGYATSCFDPIEDAGLADSLAKGIRGENQTVPPFLIDAYCAKLGLADNEKEWGVIEKQAATPDKWQ